MYTAPVEWSTATPQGGRAGELTEQFARVE